MRKILTLSAFALFLASVLIFTAFGAEIRDALSPAVRYVSLSYAKFDPADIRAYPAFPSEAVRTDENGVTYVWTVKSTDEYPEEAYAVYREDLTVIHEADGTVYVRFADFEVTGGIVTEWSGELREGQRVNAE
ncbi:MAG: hypothetical protein IJF78_02680 [Clostridia bacterium]|nr:hypothetical protein [Clostridia bacterium]